MRRMIPINYIVNTRLSSTIVAIDKQGRHTYVCNLIGKRLRIK